MLINIHRMLSYIKIVILQINIWLLKSNVKKHLNNESRYMCGVRIICSIFTFTIKYGKNKKAKLCCLYINSYIRNFIFEKGVYVFLFFSFLFSSDNPFFFSRILQHSYVNACNLNWDFSLEVLILPCGIYRTCWI